MAWYFNGTDNYQTIADHPAITLGEAFSLGFWLRSAGMADTSLHRILNWSTSAPYMEIMVYGSNHATNGGKMAVQMRTAGQTSTTIFADYNGWLDGAWHYCTIVGGGGSLLLYHDGIACETVGSIATLGTLDSAADVYLGCRWTGSNAILFLHAHLAGFAKWDRALSADSEIPALAAGANTARFLRSLAWNMPMRGDLRERQENLTVTNFGTILSEHPNVELPPQTGIVQPVIQRALGV